jgi:Single-strand binding protein family
MNKVLLTGRLTRDPELRVLASGKNVTTLSELLIPISAGGCAIPAPAGQTSRVIRRDPPRARVAPARSRRGLGSRSRDPTPLAARPAGPPRRSRP